MKNARIQSIGSLLALLTLLSACSGPHASKRDYSAQSICPNNPTGDLKVIQGARTVSLIYGRVVLDNMLSCTGLGKASLRTENEWTSRQGTFSDEGYASEVSGPMMMAIAALAGEVCQDIIEKEAPLPANDRAIFNDFDLSASAASPSNSALEKTIDRLAVGCWQRNPASEERSAIVDGVNRVIASVNTGANRAAAISVCTSMLASLSAVEL